MTTKDSQHTFSFDEETLSRRLGYYKALAKGAIFWERLWPALWPAWGIVSLLLIVTLFHLWSWLPTWLHILALVTLVFVATFSLIAKLRYLTWPTDDEAIRRLELKSGLRHRPLSALSDTLAEAENAEDDPTHHSLWRAYQQRARDSVRILKPGRPQSDLARQDPYAVRVAVVLALFVSVILSDADWKTAFQKAAIPNWQAGETTALTIDAWVNPPAYTGVAPIFLTRDQSLSTTDTTQKVPSGSRLVIRTIGHEKAPQLNYLPAYLAEDIAVAETPATLFEEIAPLTFEFARDLDEDVSVMIDDGQGTQLAWDFKIIHDQIPSIAFTDDVSATDRQVLKVPYTLLDDYGVVNSVATIKLKTKTQTITAREPVDDKSTPADKDVVARIDLMPEEARQTPSLGLDELDPIVIELPLPAFRTKRATDEVYEDLTSHPWAGLDATIQLSAQDETGQTGYSETQSFVIPERQFNDALARAVIEQRKWLGLYPEDALIVADYIDAFTRVPEKYFGDATAYLMLRIVYHRLQDLTTQEQLESTYQLLWDIAIRLEDGNLTLAAQQIRDLQRELMDALADNKPQDEIDKIIAALRDVINQYRQALIEQGLADMQRGQMPEQMPDMNNAPSAGDRIEELLKALEDMLRAGDMAGAQEIMSQLMDAMENMQFGGLQQGGPGQGNSPMDNALNGLGDMIGRQRGLMDETFRQGQPQQDGQNNGSGRGDFRNPDPYGRPGQQFGQSLEDLLRRDPFGSRNNRNENGQGNPAERGDPQPGLSQDQRGLQQELEQMLGDLENQNVDRPDALNRALQAMEEAARDLAEGDLAGALDNQNQAIDQMRQGAQEMAQALLEQMQTQIGEQQEGRRDGEERDPLGRAQAGNGAQIGDSVKVPEERDLQRAREILEELRRRASELNRSVEELDYLERLLRRF